MGYCEQSLEMSSTPVGDLAKKINCKAEDTVKDCWAKLGKDCESKKELFKWMKTDIKTMKDISAFRDALILNKTSSNTKGYSRVINPSKTLGFFRGCEERDLKKGNSRNRTKFNLSDEDEMVKKASGFTCEQLLVKFPRACDNGVTVEGKKFDAGTVKKYCEKTCHFKKPASMPKIQSIFGTSTDRKDPIVARINASTFLSSGNASMFQGSDEKKEEEKIQPRQSKTTRNAEAGDGQYDEDDDSY